MTFDEYRKHDAVGLAQLVAKREVTPRELLDAARVRAAAVNPAINAIINSLDDEADKTLSQPLPTGPLSGVPYLLKDIGAQMKGVVTTTGSRLFVNARTEADSAIVTAYRKAGLVIFGKTNTPEFGLAATTEPVLFGPSRNPWNTSRSTGGSSGGAAAAVIAGIVPAAHASDGGGSIRTPASCCGVFGLKPTRGRVSMAPGGEGWGSLSVQHAVTRSVRDSAALLDAVCQPVPGDPYWATPPERPYLEEVGRDPGRLRIGFTTASLTWGTLDTPNLRGVRETARLCESLGHTVEEVVFPGNCQMMAMAVNVLVSSNIAAALDREADRRGAAIREDEVEKLTWAVYQEARKQTGVTYANAMQTIHAYGRSLTAMFGKYDILLTSTNSKPPYPLGWMDTNAEDLAPYGERIYTFSSNTQPFNVNGSPAMSMPLAWTDDAMPIGMQFAAAPGREDLLFRLASQIEQAAPWADKRPPLS